MFLDLLRPMPDAFNALGISLQIASCTVLVLLFVLFLWRLVRFTILPALRPDEPKELPYWIPFVGHAISFFRDQESLFRCGRSYFGTDRLPFAMTLAGAKVYILTSAQDIASAYKNLTTLSFDDNVQEVMKNFGLSADGSEKMWRRDYNGIYPNPTKKSFAVLNYELNKTQLHPGSKLDNLTDKFMEYIEGFLKWESFPQRSLLQTTSNWKRISLMALCQDILVDAGSRAIFGATLNNIQSDLAQYFLKFDENSWQLLYQVPPAFAKDMYAGKQKVINTLITYLGKPQEQRDDAAWIVKTMEMEMRQLDMRLEDMAVIFFVLYWLANVNAYKSTFWLLSYVLAKPRLLSELQVETAAAVKAQSIDVDYLSNSCPRLNAVFDETVRLTNSASSVRNVVSDTIINGKIYRAGSKIIMPYRQLHFNEDVFGQDPDSFDHERFLRTKDLNRNPNYKPFGGGSTLCSGRFIARREVLVFVAVLLNRFDITLAELEDGPGKASRQQTFPRFDRTKPGLGIMDPRGGDDFILNVRLRHRS